MSEVRIEKLNTRKEKESVVREQARKCLRDRVKIDDPSNDLSSQLFKDAPTLYLNPTEKMYISKLVVPNSRVLTVLASGDFAIESAFHGAKEIVTFDDNRNQYFPAALKVKGQQSMSYDDNWSFFSDTSSPMYLSEDMFKKLKRQAENDLLLFAFFDEIIKQKKVDKQKMEAELRKTYSDVDLLKNMLRKMGLDYEPGDIEIDKALIEMNRNYSGSLVFRTIAGLRGVKTKGTYLENEASFKASQDRIKNTRILFLKANLTRIKNALEAAKVDGKYDVIYLSNIPEYINGDVFANTVKNQLMPLLSDGGTISYCCQSTSAKTLTMSQEELSKLKSRAGILANAPNILALYQIINSVEAYSLLKEDYSIELEEEEALSAANGLEDKDTYVYIRK